MQLEYQMAEMARRQKLIQVQLLSYQDRLAISVWFKYETGLVVNNKPQMFLHMCKNVSNIVTYKFLHVSGTTWPDVSERKTPLFGIWGFFWFWFISGITLLIGIGWFMVSPTSSWQMQVEAALYNVRGIGSQMRRLFSVCPDTRLA